MAAKRDFYEVLGIDKNADEATIKKAYRKLAKKYHPDMNKGNPNAEKIFQEVTEAYKVLGDPKKGKLRQFHILDCRNLVSLKYLFPCAVLITKTFYCHRCNTVCIILTIPKDGLSVSILHRISGRIQCCNRRIAVWCGNFICSENIRLTCRHLINCLCCASNFVSIIHVFFNNGQAMRLACIGVGDDYIILAVIAGMICIARTI